MQFKCAFWIFFFMTYKNIFYFYNRHYQTVETYLFNLIFNIDFKITKIIFMYLYEINEY